MDNIHLLKTHHQVYGQFLHLPVHQQFNYHLLLCQYKNVTVNLINFHYFKSLNFSFHFYQ